MDKKAKKRVRGVAIFLVFLAMAITIFEYAKVQARGGSQVNLKSYQTEFRNQKWLNKVSFELSSQNIAASLQKMDELSNAPGNRTLKREKRSNYGVYMFSLSKPALDNLRQQLGKIGNIGAEMEVVDTSLVNTNYDIEAANLASYEKDLAELDKIRVPSDPELRRKESLRVQIKLTQQKLEALQRGDSYLVYVSIIPALKSSNAMSTVRSLVTIFFKWLGICFVGIILVYFGTRLLMFLLAMMGVKGLGMSGVGGAYQYGGYSGYASKYYSRYGYGRSRRKTKRIYKEKESSSEPKDNGPE